MVAVRLSRPFDLNSLGSFFQGSYHTREPNWGQDSNSRSSFLSNFSPKFRFWGAKEKPPFMDDHDDDHCPVNSKANQCVCTSIGSARCFLAFIFESSSRSSSLHYTTYNTNKHGSQLLSHS